MTATVPLIKVRSLRRIRFGSLHSASPYTAVVCADKLGRPVHLARRGLRWWHHAFPRYRILYEVDRSYHRHLFDVGEKELPARGGVYFFDATVDVDFRVADPIKVVRRNVEDGLTIVRSYVVNAMRTITLGLDIADSAVAERMVNRSLGVRAMLNEGIIIYSCSARIRPAERFCSHLEAMADVEHASLLDEVTRELEISRAERQAQVEEIRHSAKIDGQARAIHALGSQKLSPRQLIGLYLQSHPKDGARALELLVQYEQGLGSRQGVRDDKWLELFRYMVQKDLVEAGDIARFKDQMMGQLWAPAVAERESTDVVLPVYLVVDESVPTVLDELNAGMTSLHSGLVGEPRAANAIRLCVMGFAEHARVLLEPRARAGQGVVPAFRLHEEVGGPVRVATYWRVFRHLFERLSGDVSKLWGEGLGVHRPVIFFLTARRPAHEPTWKIWHEQLIDRRTRSYAPHIVVYGIDTADRADVGRIATQPDFAFFAPGDRTPAIRNAFTAIQRSVVKSGHAFSENRVTMIISRPRDFDLALGSTGASTQPPPQPEGDVAPMSGPSALEV